MRSDMAAYMRLSACRDKHPKCHISVRVFRSEEIAEKARQTVVSHRLVV